jgi:hypothetical protein
VPLTDSSPEYPTGWLMKRSFHWARAVEDNFGAAGLASLERGVTHGCAEFNVVSTVAT